VKSYNVNEDYILSLHQKVSKEAPIPAPREVNGNIEADIYLQKDDDVVDNNENKFDNVISQTEDEILDSPTDDVGVVSYEEERSKMDFDDIVKQNMSKYKEERERSNRSVLEEIAREEGEDRSNGEDRPNVKELLAWAKGTKKPLTETTKVRNKKRQELLRHAVNVDGVTMVIESKKVEDKKEEAVSNGIKDSKVTIVRNNKTQGVAEAKQAVTKDWVEKAVKEVEGNTAATVPNMEVIQADLGQYLINIEVDVLGRTKNIRWQVGPTPSVPKGNRNRDLMVLTELGPQMGRFADHARSKAPLSLPFQRILFTDNQLSALPDISAYRAADCGSYLDEAHLKAGMKALAKLHAVSFAFFASNREALPRLADSALNTDDKEALKQKLDLQVEGLVSLLSKVSGLSQGVLEWAKGLKRVVHNVYREAKQYSSVFSVLCHGSPSPKSIVFAYKDDVPVDAKVVDFSSCSYSSAATDLQVFINTGGDNTAREDFLLRFVYYETLVTVLKSLGVKDPISFEDLKKEYIKKRLFGYIESSFLLTSSAGPPKAVPAQTQSRISGSREVNSKILGKFSPKAKVAAVAAFSSGQKSPTDKIVEMVSRAAKIK